MSTKRESDSKSKKPYRKFYITLLLLGLAALVASTYVYRNRSSIEIAYREVPVSRGDLQVSVVSTGTVEPKNRFDIRPPVAGRIDKVMVHEGQFVKSGEVLALMSSTERASLLDAARSQGPAAVKRWEKNYKQIPILAPISGTVIRSDVETGKTFSNADTVVVMSDILTVKAQVDETDISSIHLKAKALIVLDAYPDTEIPAHVDDVAYDAKTINNVTTYIVGVLPEKTPDFMRSGMTANITFALASKIGVINIPNDSLRVKDNKFSVLVKTLDQPREKTIVVGLTDGKRTEVISGLAEGETVLAAELVGPANEGKSRSSTSAGKK